MKILRILLAAAGLAGAAFFGFCAWALWGPFRSVAVAALLAAVLCLAGGVAALLAGRKDPKAQGPFAASAYELGGPDNAAPDRTVPAPETRTGPRFSGTFLAVSGLDLPEGTRCRLAYEDSCLRVTALDHDFTLAHEKVRTAAILTHKDIRRQYVSSAGGAVAGAMLLGPTATTTASCGFSCAELARIMPDFVVSSAFFCCKTTLSPKGFNFITLPSFCIFIKDILFPEIHAG